MLIDKKTCKTREYQRFCGMSGECAEMCGLPTRIPEIGLLQRLFSIFL